MKFVTVLRDLEGAELFRHLTVAWMWDGQPVALLRIVQVTPRDSTVVLATVTQIVDPALQDRYTVGQEIAVDASEVSAAQALKLLRDALQKADFTADRGAASPSGGCRSC